MGTTDGLSQRPLGGAEFDLVFSNSTEYVSLTAAFKDNIFAQNAARILKVAQGQSAAAVLTDKLPSFVLSLETLVLEAQRRVAQCHSHKLGDGSMQLFCEALQLIERGAV